MTADELAWSQFNLMKFQVYFIPKSRGGPDRDQNGGFYKETRFKILFYRSCNYLLIDMQATFKKPLLTIDFKDDMSIIVK